MFTESDVADLAKLARGQHVVIAGRLKGVSVGMVLFTDSKLIEPEPTVTKINKAAWLGNAEAQALLGSSYQFGEGVPKDEAEALKWYRRAAEQGNALGQAFLGAMYGNGTGVPKDYAEAYKWMLLGSAQGSEASKKHIATLEPLLSPEQRAEGQRRAREFKTTPEPAPKATAGASAEAQMRAITAYPALGVADSPLNREFLVRAKRYQVGKPELFNDPEWPTKLAEECQRAIDGK